MYHHFFILFFIAVSFQSIIAHDDQVSFAVDLIHRDSPDSPFYNQSLTPSELSAKDVMRYRAAVNGFNSSSAYMDDNKSMVHADQEKRKLLESQYIGIRGGRDYVIKYYLGSKNIPTFLYLDLTTDFVWTKGGVENPEQRKAVYDPEYSPSHRVVFYNSRYCGELRAHSKVVRGKEDECEFEHKDRQRQLDGKGVLISDRFYFHESSKDEGWGIVFGCVDDKKRLDEFDIGVLGLGRGYISFISQLQREASYDKFSYCLQTDQLNKLLRFGDLPDEIQPNLVASTPLQPSSSGDSSYYLKLESVQVGSSHIEALEHRIRIDFGTKWTFLDDDLYKKVVREVRQKIWADPILPLYLGLCYKDEDLKKTIEFSIFFRFEGPAFIEINYKSLFGQEYENGEHCMTILKTNDGKPRSVIGSLAQMGHVIQFDLRNQLAYLAPTDDCGSFNA